MERQVILTFDGVCISYGPKSVVENLSFTLRQGEVLAIIGESGSGKTSLLKAILGLLEPEGNVTQGRIFYKDIPLLRISSPERRHLLGVFFKIQLIHYVPFGRLVRKSMKWLNCIRSARKMM